MRAFPSKMAKNVLKRYPFGGKARAILPSRLAVTAGNEATLKLGVRSDSSYSNHALLLRQSGFEPLVTIRPFGLTACYRGYRERHTRTPPYNTHTDPARSQPPPLLSAVTGKRLGVLLLYHVIKQLSTIFARLNIFSKKPLTFWRLCGIILFGKKIQFRGVAQLGRALRSGASNVRRASIGRLRQIPLYTTTFRRFCRAEKSVRKSPDHFSDHIGQIHHISRRGSAW